MKPGGITGGDSPGGSLSGGGNLTREEFTRGQFTGGDLARWEFTGGQLTGGGELIGVNSPGGGLTKGEFS